MAADIKTFIADVDRMRELQCTYFRTRDLAPLDAARAAEKRVDAQLDQLTGRRQPTLPGMGGTHGNA
jgi:hypothetical protein